MKHDHYLRFPFCIGSYTVPMKPDLATDYFNWSMVSQTIALNHALATSGMLLAFFSFKIVTVEWTDKNKDEKERSFYNFQSICFSPSSSFLVLVPSPIHSIYFFLDLPILPKMQLGTTPVSDRTGALESNFWSFWQKICK